MKSGGMNTGGGGFGGASSGNLAKAVSAGMSHTCAITVGGGGEMLGNNATGELGDSSANDSPVPVDVVGLASGVAAIAAGGGHTCAVTQTGALKCWGWNLWGQLGTVSNRQSCSRRCGGPLVRCGAVAVGNGGTCAVTATGAVTVLLTSRAFEERRNRSSAPSQGTLVAAIHGTHERQPG